MLLNRAKVSTATANNGTVTLGAAVAPYQTWAAATPIDGGTYSYLIEDGTAWESGRGVYAAGADTLTRPGPGVDATFDSSTGALLALSGAATVACVAGVADFIALAGMGGSADFASVVFSSDGTILESQNVSSVTHVGTGKYLINFTTPAGDVNKILPSFAAINAPAGNDNLVTLMIDRATGDGVTGGLTVNSCFVETFGTDPIGAYDVDVGFARFGYVGGANRPGILGEVIAVGGETFLNIPTIAAGRDMRIVLTGALNGGTAELDLTFNGDTSASYDWAWSQKFAINSGSSDTKIYSGQLNNADFPSPGILDLFVAGYSSATMNKYLSGSSEVRIGTGAGNIIPWTVIGEYLKTDPITEINIAAPGSTFVAGTRLTAYEL